MRDQVVGSNCVIRKGFWCGTAPTCRYATMNWDTSLAICSAVPPAGAHYLLLVRAELLNGSLFANDRTDHTLFVSDPHLFLRVDECVAAPTAFHSHNIPKSTSAISSASVAQTVVISL